MSLKLVVFLFFPVLIALIFGFVFVGFNIGKGLILLPISLAVGFIFLALFLIQCLIISASLEALAVIIIESAAMVAPILLVGNFNYAVYIGFASLLLFLIWGYYSGQQELQNSINIQFFRLRKPVLRKAIIGMTLFSVLVYVSFLDLEKLIVSKNAFEYFVRPIEYSGRIFLSNFSANMTIGEFLTSLAEKNLSPEEKNLVVINTIAKLTEWTKFNIGIQHRLGDTIYQIINFQLHRLPADRQTPVLIGIGATLFLFITGFGLLFSWIIGLISYGLYQLLLTYGFIIITYQNKQIEALKL
ncbi:MAG: hypothetical protein AAB847_01510 [Patescibacteria group bacterium]